MKKTLITVVTFAVAIVLVCIAGFAIEPASSIQSIQPDSPCPVTGCASGQCHGYTDVPEPDGIHEMICPEAGCASTECHAWDTLTGRYHQASDASLNLWILMPVILVIALVFIVRALSKNKKNSETDASSGDSSGDDATDHEQTAANDNQAAANSKPEATSNENTKSEERSHEE